MTICIIGGSGFIGSTLARQLTKQGQAFRIVDLKPSPFFPEQTVLHDIRKPLPADVLEGMDTIIHLAAVHRDDVRDPAIYHDTNVTGTSYVCDAATAQGITRIVYASSVAVYGFAPRDTGEDGAIAPFNDYGRTKYEGEQVLRAWYDADPASRDLTFVRPTVVFGPGNRGNVYNLLNQIHSGRFLMIGDGLNRKSLAYVDNVAAFFGHMATTPVQETGLHIYNYVDKPDFDMNALVSHVRGILRGQKGVGFRLPVSLGLAAGRLLDFVARVSGRTFPISAVRVSKFTSDSAFMTAAHDVEGFVAPIPLGEGLRETLTREFLSDQPVEPIFFTE